MSLLNILSKDLFLLITHNDPELIIIMCMSSSNLMDRYLNNDEFWIDLYKQNFSGQVKLSQLTLIENYQYIYIILLIRNMNLKR
jgi:H+/gluconate symporter-like permease